MGKILDGVALAILFVAIPHRVMLGNYTLAFVGAAMAVYFVVRLIDKESHA